MKSNLNEAVAKVLQWEGGYSNHPKDPGGPTNYGITIADVRKYIKADATAIDVMNLTKAQAIEIYKNKYWKTQFYDCDTLASGVDLAVFDFGVNSGPARAKRYLDASVGGSSVDTINKLCDKRMTFLRGLSAFGIFGTGWTNRVKDIRATALSWTKRKAPITTGKATATTGIWAALGALAVGLWDKLPPYIWVFGGVTAVALTLLILSTHKGK